MAVCGKLVNVNDNAIEYVIGPVTEFFIGIPVRSTSVYDSNHSNLGWRWDLDWEPKDCFHPGPTRNVKAIAIIACAL